MMVSAGVPSEGAIELTAICDGTTDRIRFRSKDVVLAARPEASVSAFLPHAMRRARPLLVDGALCERFSYGIGEAQAIYASWFPELRPVVVTTALEGRNRSLSTSGDGAHSSSRAGRVAAFFTGGVDSFYTFLKKQDEIDTLVYVHGFDVELEDFPLRKKVSAMLQSVAESMGKRLIELESDFRRAFQGRLVSRLPNWPFIHGAALATAAHLLPDVSRMYIPATFTYANLEPWGSHPLLDPKWSSSRLELIHHGCEADRIGKCRFIASSELALQSLRVCWENPNSVYNCGRCEKCRRTMINLAAVGALDRCRTFDSDLHADEVARMRIRSRGEEIFVLDNLRHLRGKHAHTDLVKALERVLRRYNIAYRWFSMPRKMAGQLLQRVRSRRRKSGSNS